MANDIRFILKQLAAGFSNGQMSDETVAVYARLLQDIPPADLQTVVDQCLAECKFLPTIAEIRERYIALTKSLGALSAAEAWGLVTGQIRAIGSWGAPEFDDPLTARVVEMMGWRELCQSENQMADRAQFMRMYQEIRDRHDRIDNLLPQARRMLETHTGRDVQSLTAQVAKRLTITANGSGKAEPDGKARPLDDEPPF